MSTETIPTRVVTVAAVADLAPRLRQITFGGLGGLDRRGLDDFFLVIRPRPGHEHMLDDGSDFADHRDLPEDERPGWAYYTVRRWRPDAGEIDVWFVLHDHHGPISGWARRAAIGERVALWGPRISFDPPPGTTSLLLVGDETGLGAFASIIEGADPALAITVVLECDARAIDLPDRPGAVVHATERADRAPTKGSGLVDVVAGLKLPTHGLYAYGAGESHLVSEIRTHLRHTRGLLATQVQMVGYWRRQP